MDSKQRIQELIPLLNKARYTYEQEDTEIMSNYEYDKLYDELLQLEKETGIAYSNSPTQQVGYTVSSKLQKVKHETKMLSLDKTKDIQKLKAFLGNQSGLLSFKLDGLTTVIYYDNGELQQGVTRGSGEIGEDITSNVKVFDNIPLTIPFKGKLKMRGESVITYSQFEKINELITNIDEKYKNPRNLCSGSVRQLDNKICKERKPKWYGFEVIEIEGINHKLKSCRLNFIEELGFETVRRVLVDKDNIEFYVEQLTKMVEEYDIPVDGLVVTLDDIEYGKSLGVTSHHPLDGMAFKWTDEIQETKLLRVEFQPSRTGLLNPVAIFEPVELEGTTVERASLHNLSIIEDLELGIGDIITCYKANQIIPQVEDNLTHSNTLEIPKTCPLCGEPTEIKATATSKVLLCNNPNCQAKLIQQLSLFVSRDAMNIEGLSEATLEKFIDKGFIKNICDIYQLHRYKNEIINMDGFGKKSYDNLISSIDKSKKCKLENFITALGISNVGKSTSKLLTKTFKTYDNLKQCSFKELYTIDGVGEIVGKSIYQYFHTNQSQYADSLVEFVLDIETEEKRQVVNTEGIFSGYKLYCTGTFANYKKEQLKKIVEDLGGEFANGYAKSLDWLVVGSLKGSSKTEKALKDNVKVLAEEEFLEMIK